MEQTVIYLLMVQKFVNLEQKTLKLMQFHYVQETFQKTSLDNMKKIEFYRYVHDFRVDYDDAIAVDDILEIHKYLMKKVIYEQKLLYK